MRIRKVLSILLLTGASISAHAALYDRGNGQVYDSSLGFTWSKDANLFGTLSNASGDYAGFITDVINANNGALTNVTDYYNPTGIHQLTAQDFSASNDWSTVPGIFSGLTWWGAEAFAIYLNKISYLGSNTWSLPNYLPVNNPSSFPVGLSNNGHGTFIDMATGNIDSFINFNAGGPYWLGINGWYGAATWFYYPNNVGIGVTNKSNGYGAWFVHSGDVTYSPEPSSIPEPTIILLFGTGLLGMIGAKQRKNGAIANLN